MVYNKGGVNEEHSTLRNQVMESEVYLTGSRETACKVQGPAMPRKGKGDGREGSGKILSSSETNGFVQRERELFT